ncbi:magnesium transporter NIPA-domain-containing protein [Aspergillus coremiiformis]|uniref:Magnesium transporter NIPA-domain-containing protein n=1 Tax=Aspergillus coremiiformis TaxID=138285 RepID=A0A5N6YVF8_9EURO|nr:magnesium transporter NIPA-domain-containing protein [Aspergillus coremiiformis]
MDFSSLQARSNSANGRPASYKAVGISLAVASGLFIGVSFVLKKAGLLKANVKYNEEAGEGYGYLKNFYWWAGMTLMIIGEICNFVAYAFVDAILVTPLGALSVVVTTILSAIFLKERLSFVGKVGCFTCILGSVIIAMNAPEQSSVSNIQEMQRYVIAPGFLSYAGVIVVGSTITALWAGPRYGKKSMFVYISICSSIGGLSVVATQGLGAAILAQINGESQFKQWFLYVLLAFVVTTLLTEIIYLNKALNIFNAALVTPTYYVLFTSATIITSAILFRGFKGTGMQIATVILGFLQICAGVVLLQLSKSAKDVPDSAVFKGDLDQIREVATQEEPETEPKADSIRGTAAILRRISTPRRTMEAEEARRYFRERQEDRLHPPAENEIIEWDGLRRRKTVLGEGPTMGPSPSSVRRPLPPLGMSRFPDESERPSTRQSGHSFLDEIRMRSPSHSWQPIQDHDPTQPVTSAPVSSVHSEHVDTSYPGPTRSDIPHSITWADDGPEPPVHGAKRQFSFHAFHRPKPDAPKPPRSILRKGHERGSPTEEESLGLVRGDSGESMGEKLDRVYSNDSMEDESPSDPHRSAAAPPYEEHHFHPLEASPQRSSRLIRNPLPPLPDEAPLEPYTQVELDSRSDRRGSHGSAGSLSSGPNRQGLRRAAGDHKTDGGPRGAFL